MDQKEFIIRYGQHLNEQQLQAVESVEGPVLLPAVPGSGKTTVLVTRIGYMILCCNIPAKNILVLTYTIAATKDMGHRFASIFGNELAKDVEFRTINGICAKIIQAYGKKIGKEPFELLVYEFACKHKVAIEKINYYEWAKFLEKVNENSVVDHLLSKIDESTLHTRNSLSYYRDILFQEFENKCFYCGKPVTYGHVEVDHFIPWSFIKDDNLWNFVLACPACNNNKRDKLADGIFLDRIEKRNRLLIERQKVDSRVQIGRVRQIYTWAQRNGYSEIWKPKEERITL